MQRLNVRPSTRPGSVHGVFVLGMCLAAGACGSEAPSNRFAVDPDTTPAVINLDPEEAARMAREANAENTAIVTPGFALTLVAPEALVADPIALSVDDQGRILYTRTNRSGQSEFDIRNHRDWMVESITFQTVEDRRNFLRRELAPERSAENEWLEDYNGDGSRDWRDLTVQREQVFRLEDTSGDGVADVAHRLISDFRDEHTDVANGLLAYGDDIFVGIAPDLWRLRDSDGDNLIDVKESISHGYGVHIGFSGHGMSGITMGPDGRIYWGIGDIGFNVTDQTGRQWAYPNQGGIFRAEPDGSNFEVFAAGVRNTHEFAFDEYGNLISVDNDGDHPGEQERVVYLVDGSDSGWRINWQFGKYDEPINNSYKVWMEEGLFRPRFDDQAAYILPPIASYHAGPSGMVYNPGTALSPEWRNHFFVSAFTGSPANTRIHAFTLEPDGAGFQLASDTVVLRGILTTGMDIGPDGALYLADWVTGWATKQRGRIWKLDTPSEAGSALREETRQLVGADFGERSEADLVALLRHQDMRIRTKAQFALADRGAVETLASAAQQREHQLARIHGLWGIGQLTRGDPSHATRLLSFLDDEDPEIAAQTAKLLGDVRHAAAATHLTGLLAHESARVRFFAAEALGRIGHAPAVQPLIEMLASNDDRDAYLRHGGAIALARIGSSEPLANLTTHPSRAVRIAAVIALRRMKDPAVAGFLRDADDYVVAEAARAINDDESIEPALPALAELLEDPRFTSEPIIRRVINANLRVGTPAAAARLAAYAVAPGPPEAMRIEALLALSVLPEPSILDRVDGFARGPVQRDAAIARNALDPAYVDLIGDASVPLRVAAAEAAGRLRLQSASPHLLAKLADDPSPEVRSGALLALHEIRVEPLEPVVRTALADRDANVRMTALRLVPEAGLPDAVTTDLLVSMIGSGSVQEQQAAVASLGELGTPAADAALGGLLDRLTAGELPAAVELELLEAVDSSSSAPLRTRGEQVRIARAGGTTVTAFADLLEGGDRNRGQQVAMRNESAQCTRCHIFGDQGPEGPATSVGPALRTIGAQLTREQLLESLVDPSARVPAGFTTPSAMPAMQNLLTRRQIRDVVEYLSTLR